MVRCACHGGDACPAREQITDLFPIEEPEAAMRAIVRGLSGVCIAACLLLSNVLADDEKVALDQLPKAVTEAVKVKFPNAELTGAEKETEDGKSFYEVAIKHKGAKYEVTVTPEGKITEIEKEIAAKDLPKAVTDALQKKHPQSTIKEAEELTAGDKVTYEVVIATADKKNWEIVLDPQGKILKEEEDDEEEDKE
jgi:uncharacterized membrane protein YkoI